MTVAIQESTGTCPECQAEAPFRTIIFNGVDLDPLCFCPECDRKIGQWWQKKQSNDARDQAEHISRLRLTEWQMACPAEFRPEKYEPERITEQKIKHIPDTYEAGQSIGICGTARTGKTRIAYLCLHKAHQVGHSIAAINHPDLVRLATQAACNEPGAEHDLDRLKGAHTILLDDIGKGADTPRGLEALWALVNHRYNNGMATIWTANGAREYLMAKLGEEHGKSIVGKLAQLTDPVVV